MLRGIFCVYKPANISCAAVRQTLIGNLCRGRNLALRCLWQGIADIIFILSQMTSLGYLNEMEVRPPTDFVSIEGGVGRNCFLRWEASLVTCEVSTSLGRGLMALAAELLLTTRRPPGHILALNAEQRNTRIKNSLRWSEPGWEQGNCPFASPADSHETGPCMFILGSLSFGHRKAKYAGVPLNSQAAFEMAAKDTVRPADKSPPLVYNIRCVELDLPYFTLDVTWAKEDEGLGSDHSVIDITIRGSRYRAVLGKARITDWDKMKKFTQEQEEAYEEESKLSERKQTYTEWARDQKKALQKFTQEIATTSQTPYVDARLTNMWAAQDSLTRRWKRQRRNKSWPSA
ncbi:hypothetical protein HPB51_029603 [Rhipicephalus microplus]|uniref:Tick transposon n=1 Tax=Rhipicephalus microplus TaxID=6941 RepID=A0A9J6CTI4_RHIMP|nr:hypothetical protein HPB51_029603 [Rhipicephalus microplus]